MMETNKEVAEVARLLADLTRGRFFGELLMKFEAGRITTVKKTETLKVGSKDWNYWEDRGGHGQR